MDLGRYQEAVESFDKIIKLNEVKGEKLPSNFFLQLTWCNGYGGKAMALTKLGKWEQVLECYDQLIKQEPNNEHHHHGRAKALLNLRRIEEALKSLEIALHH